MTDTSKYGLHLFEGTDPVDVDKFNENTEAIEAAIAGAGVKMVTGCYTGDGTDERTISLGFTPKAIFVTAQNGLLNAPNSGYNFVWGGLAITGKVNKDISSSDTLLSIVDGGIKVYYKINNTNKVYTYTNKSDIEYRYLAFL